MTEIDKTLYSRQLYVIGKSAMGLISKTTVLIYGLDGLGLEISKCLILSGIGTLIIYDDKNIDYLDLTSNYYVNENSIGKNRVTETINSLKELNSYVNIIQADISKPITDHITKEIDIMVAVNCNLSESLKLNESTRKNNIKFITSTTFSVFGQIFCDFGDFTIVDYDDNEIKNGIIVNIINNNGELDITTVDQTFLTKNDVIIINGHELLSNKEYQVKNILAYNKFTIECTKYNKAIELVTGVYFTQIKKERKLCYKSMKEAQEEKFNIKSFTYDSSLTPKKVKSLHVGFKGINEYFLKYNKYPARYNTDDKNNFIDICKNIDDNIDEKLLTHLSYTLTGQLCPIHSIIASITSQEIMKACSGKFTPIHQTFVFEATDILPDKVDDIEIKNRYYGQNIIFGNEFTNKLNKEKIWIIGSGAIGCEHIKNFSMMGVGNILITDMDTIEKSNLSRQFLFRNSDISKFKSEVACREISKMNPNINVEFQINKVCEETRNIYDKNFYESLTAVATALDNNASRLFVDAECVRNKVVLLEAGTLGAKCSTQTIIPHLTERYGSSQDSAENFIPVCTLKNFPYNINHTVQWALDFFEGVFRTSILNLKKYKNNENFIGSLSEAESGNVMNDILNVYSNIPNNFDDCLNFAHIIFDFLFNEQIEVLIAKYPIDHKDSNGINFWSGNKIFPHILKYDENKKYHNNFVTSCANIWASIFNIENNNSNIQINKTKNKFSYDINDISELKKQCSLIDKTIIKDNIKIIDFDKDNDLYIKFITSCSNLRADNYKIKNISKAETKKIGGKIIPALCSSTVLVSGLVSLELYKVVSKKNKIEDYKNHYINLAISVFTSCDPENFTKLCLNDKEFSIWNPLELNDMTIEELLDYFEIELDSEILTINYGDKIFYSDFIAEEIRKKRYKMKVSEIIIEINKEYNEKLVILTIIIDSDSDDSITCRINF